jgi:hypothetical protein
MPNVEAEEENYKGVTQVKLVVNVKKNDPSKEKQPAPLLPLWGVTSVSDVEDIMGLE